MSKAAIKQFSNTVAHYDKRYLPKRKRKQEWISPGRVESVAMKNSRLILTCAHASIELRWMTGDCLRVRVNLHSDQFDESSSVAVEKMEWAPVGFHLVEGDEALEITTSKAVYRIARDNLRIGIESLDGKLLCVDALGMRWCDDGAAQLTMALQPDEACYGLGLRAAKLNLRGKRLKMWNTDTPHYMRGTDPLYYCVPFYLGVHDNGVYGVLWDNSHRGFVDAGSGKHNHLTFGAEAGELRYFLFAGHDTREVLSRYTELTGRIILPPVWALGYQQSRYSYRSQDEVLKLAEELRERRIPCDVIYLDIHYMDGFRVFTWHPEHFNDFEQLIAQLHAKGFRVVAIIDPGIKIDAEYDAYKTGLERDVFLKYPDGEPVMGVVWPGACHFPDFTNPATQTWWAAQCAKLLEAGVDGLWNDMCEPSVFTDDEPLTLPEYVQHANDGQGGNHLTHHNTYGMLMGRASAHALQHYRSEQRPVNIIRAGYAGAQRYATTWTGDNTSSWDHLHLCLSMVLNMGLSGAPMIGPDIGGFHEDSDGELLTRWLQAACLMPYYRNHTALDTRAQETWAFGQPYEVINRITIELRYRLLPYLYSVVAQAREYGWPIVRPLFMAEPKNHDLRSVDDCYMLGDALLVAPVLERGAVQRMVYLPAGDWYDYWSNDLLTGGRKVEVMAPLERLPLFVRAGMMLPLWPSMQHTDEHSVEQLTLRAYPGDAETVLYEDRGEGFEYVDGDYRWVYLSSHREDDVLILRQRVAGRYVPSYQSIKIEVVGLADEPTSVRVDRKGAPVWFFDEGLLDLTLDTTFRQIEIERHPHSDYMDDII